MSSSLSYQSTPNVGSATNLKGLLIDRFHHPSSEEHVYKTKGKNKNNVALSALTLLAFLFFLNILQNCIQDHMDDMKGKGKGMQMIPQQVMMPVTLAPARREAQRKDVIEKKGDNLDEDAKPEDRSNPEAKKRKHRKHVKNSN